MLATAGGGRETADDWAEHNTNTTHLSRRRPTVRLRSPTVAQCVPYLSPADHHCHHAIALTDRFGCIRQIMGKQHFWPGRTGHFGFLRPRPVVHGARDYLAVPQSAPERLVLACHLAVSSVMCTTTVEARGSGRTKSSWSD